MCGCVICRWPPGGPPQDTDPQSAECQCVCVAGAVCDGVSACVSRAGGGWGGGGRVSARVAGHWPPQRPLRPAGQWPLDLWMMIACLFHSSPVCVSLAARRPGHSACRKVTARSSDCQCGLSSLEMQDTLPFPHWRSKAFSSLEKQDTLLLQFKVFLQCVTSLCCSNKDQPLMPPGPSSPEKTGGRPNLE